MKKLIASILLIASAIPAMASNCPSLYPNNKPIAVEGTVELCNQFHVSVFDKDHNAVVFTSERLRKDAAVGSMTRLNVFKSDTRLVNGPKNSEYLRTGLDRGHMAPSDDASTAQEVTETFLLTNMTPQEPTLNRIAWKKLEGDVRKMYRRSSSDVFVITVAVYNKPAYMGRIPKPNGYWKIVYTSSGQRFFFAENKPNATVDEYTSIDLKKILSPNW